jgi:hypothetical protein
MSMKRVSVSGKTLNQRTLDMLKCAEARLGYDLYVVQGSYNAGGVSASAGTHDGGGAVDVAPGSNPTEQVRALREVGFAAWHRVPSQGPWNEHIHAIAIGDAELSSGARTQVSEYYAGQNGLASHAPDDGPKVSPIPTWPLKFAKVYYGVVAWQFKAKTPKAKVSVKRAQEALKSRGYYHDAVDGVAGPRTRGAYAAFLKKRGYSGGVNRANIKALCKGYYTVL